MEATAKKQSHSEEQAQAQFESICEMVAALGCDYDRLEELRDEKPQWVAGYNMAGYLPDSDPALFVDFDEARDYIVEQIEQSAAQHEEEDGEIMNLARAFADSKEQELSQQCADGLVYWINKIGDDEAILAGWEDFEEYEQLNNAAGDCESQDDAAQRIQEDPLEVQVRSDWHNPGETEDKPTEFYILLCTGGPAVRIMGELDEHQQPSRAWLEHQDWGTHWQHYYIKDGQNVLLTYCQQFYFGD